MDAPTIAGVVPKSTLNDVKKGKLIIIYGESGAGKTTLASTMNETEHGNPMCLLDCEGGTDSIAHLDLTKYELDTWNRAEKLVKEIQKNCPFKSVCLDHMTKFIEMCLTDIKRRRSGVKDPRQWYAELTDTIVPIVEGFNDLAWRKEIVVVLLFQQTNLQEGLVRKGTVAATPKINERALWKPDIIGNLRAENDSARSTEFVNRLSFVGSATALAKFRRPQNAVSASIPKEIWNPSLAPILDCLIGGIPFPVEKYQKPRTIKQLEAQQTQEQEVNTP
jgi:energy-coupling factor transporter ATP-binding protein EcfA2